MKTKLLTILILLAAFVVYAQKGVVNNGAKIIITNGAILEINGADGNYTNNSADASNHGKIDLDGKIKLQGNWVNNTISSNVLINTDTDGEVVFKGSTLQLITGQSTNFEKLTLNNSGGLDLNTPTNINGNLNLSTGLFNIGTHNLMLSAQSTVLGPTSASAMIVANSSGYVRKYYTGTGSFVFPIGDTTVTDEFSPIEVDFTSGTFGSGAYVQLNVANQKHPNNSSSKHYINRYWSVTSNNITSYTADITATYTDADISSGAIESSIYGAKYDDPYWNIMDVSNTATNTLTGSVTSFSDFSGAEMDAILASITIAGDGTINEGSEDSEVISIILANDDFIPSLNPTNWVLLNLPYGVTQGMVMRTGNKTATISLVGNRVVDFDTDITNITLQVGAAELVNTSSGTVDASSGVVIVANNDAESIIMSDDGLIAEGSEDGEVITVAVVGGTFVDPITDANWILTNLPVGVSKGSVTRIDETTVEIALSGNRSSDYSVDITDATLTITASEMDEYTGVDLNVNTGVTFTAVDESLDIVMSGTFSEGSESSEIITVTINSSTIHTFNSTITQDSWTLNNLPDGVTKGTVTQNSSTEVVISLNGTSVKDYDIDINNVALQIEAVEIDGFSSTATLSGGVTFIATDDAESITIANDTDGIIEGLEDGEIVTVTLTGGTFADLIELDSWAVTNLPDGVTVGDFVRISATVVELTLSGNRWRDYDTNIADVTVTILPEAIDDHSGTNISVSSGVSIAAIDDVESITIANDGDGIIEGSEDGEVITVTLLGGNFVNPIMPENWTMLNQPIGVSIGLVTRISETEVSITLSGNSTVNYDVNITDMEISIADVEVDDFQGDPLSVNYGVIFTAINNDSDLIITYNGLTEINLDGAVVNMQLIQSNFITGEQSITDVILNNAPAGLSVAEYNVITETTATIELRYNGDDFDVNYDLFSITLEAVLLNIETSISSNTLSIEAVVEPTATVTYDGEIIEGYEDGEMIDISVVNGSFVQDVNVGSISFSGYPDGVTFGNIIRSSATLLTIDLIGNSISDFDADITSVTCTIDNSAFENYSGNSLVLETPIIFTALNESLTISGDEINEGNIDGAVVLMELTDDKFIDNIIEPSSVTMFNAPMGMTVNSIDFVSETVANLSFSFDGTNFDADVTDFYISLSGTELHGIDDLVSNDLTIYTGVGIDDVYDLEVRIFANSANVFVTVDDFQRGWKLPIIIIYDANGKVVHSSIMQKENINKVSLNVKTGYYFVKVLLNDTEFVNKVFILPE